MARLSGTVTLARAVERALCANPATRSAWLAARLRAPNWDWRKRLSAGPDAWRQPGTQRRRGVPERPNRLAFRLDAQVLLYDFGGRDARRDAAESLLAAALASQDATVRVLYLQTVTAYFNLLTAQAAVVAANQTEASALAACGLPQPGWRWARASRPTVCRPRRPCPAPDRAYPRRGWLRGCRASWPR